MAAFFEYYYASIIGVCVFFTYFIGGGIRIKSRDEKIVLLFFSIIFSALLACRPDVFPDTLSYRETFEKIQVGCNYGFKPFDEIYTVEYGYFYMMYFFKAIYDDVRFFYLITNTITIVLFIEACKFLISSFFKNRFSVLTMLALYMSYFGIYYLGIAVREGITISLLMLCLCEIEKKKYIRAVVICILGFLMHRLFVVGLGVLFIWLYVNKNFGRKKYVVTWGLCGVYLIMNTSIWLQEIVFGMLWRLLPKFGINFYMGYLEDFRLTEFKRSYGIILLWLLVGVITMLKKHIDFPSRILNIIYFGLILSVLLYTLKGSSRIYDYFTVFSVIPLTIARGYYNWDSLSLKQIRINLCIACVLVCQVFLINIIIFKMY